MRADSVAKCFRDLPTSLVICARTLANSRTSASTANVPSAFRQTCSDTYATYTTRQVDNSVILDNRILDVSNSFSTKSSMKLGSGIVMFFIYNRTNERELFISKQVDRWREQ